MGPDWQKLYVLQQFEVVIFSHNLSVDNTVVSKQPDGGLDVILYVINKQQEKGLDRWQIPGELLMLQLSMRIEFHQLPQLIVSFSEKDMIQSS